MFRFIVTIAAVVAIPVGLLCLYLAVSVAWGTSPYFGAGIIVVLILLGASLYSGRKNHDHE
jgi:uncharacterized membrane protein